MILQSVSGRREWQRLISGTDRKDKGIGKQWQKGEVDTEGFSDPKEKEEKLPVPEYSGTIPDHVRAYTA